MCARTHKTCQKLRSVSLIPSYWISIAKNISRTQRPLMLPHFRRLEHIPSEELRALCMQHHRSSLNIASGEPKIRSSRVLPLPRTSASIAFLSFVPGGRYALVFLENAIVQLWDTQASRPSLSRAPGECEAIRNASYNPPIVGRMLASEVIEDTPDEYDFQISGEDTTRITVGAFYRTELVLHLGLLAMMVLI